MSFPNLRDKYKHDSIVTARDYISYKKRMGIMTESSIPDIAIVCYNRKLFESICAKYNTTLINGMSDTCIIKDKGMKVVFVKCGVGSPAMSIVIEELISMGINNIISIGVAGSLQKELGVRSIIICDRAIRDEGTSYHYMKPSKYAYASKVLTSKIKEKTKEMRIDYTCGTTWTIDTPYRETKEEIRKYQNEGVLTVEMETSALFTIAEIKNINAGAIFTVSDYLGSLRWEPKFHMVEEYLEKIFQVAKEVLFSI